MNSEQIAKWVRIQRKRQGMSVARLAEASGVSYQAIWGWEHGNHGMRVDQAHSVIEALGYELAPAKRREQ